MNKQFKFSHSIILILSIMIISVSGISQPAGWIWANSVGNQYNNFGVSCISDVHDNQVTAGYFIDTVDFDPGTGITQLISQASSSDIYLTKSDSAGNFIWAKGIGGIGEESVLAIAALESTGEIYITGHFTGTADFDPGSSIYNLTSNGNEDIFIAKYTADGNLIWAKGMGGSLNDYGSTLTIHPQTGDVYYAGSFRGNPDFDPGAGATILTSTGNNDDMFISKLDSAGNFYWAAGAGNNIGGNVNALDIALDLTGNGSVITTGSYNGNTDFDPGSGTFMLNSISQDAFILKQELDGRFKWAGTIGGADSDQGNTIAISQSGNIYLTGYFSQTADMDPGNGTSNITSSGGTDIFFVALDSAGNYLLSGSSGSANGNDFPSAIVLSNSGNEIYISGGFSGNCDFDPKSGIYSLISSGGLDLFIMATDTLLNLLWAEKAGSNNSEYSTSMSIDHSDMLRITGFFFSNILTLGNDILMNVDNSDVFTGRFNPATTTTGINISDGSDQSYFLWPDPADNILNLRLNKTLSNFIICIYDLTGKCLYEKKYQTEEQFCIPVAMLQDGMYILSLKQNHQALNSRFIIKH